MTGDLLNLRCLGIMSDYEEILLFSVSIIEISFKFTFAITYKYIVIDQFYFHYDQVYLYIVMRSAVFIL